MRAEYAAGYFDGEGCIRVQKEGTVRVAISNTYRVILEKFAEEFGGGVHFKRPADGPRREQWMWVAQGTAAGTFLHRVLPYLVEKAPQARLAMALQGHKDMCKRGAWNREYGKLVAHEISRLKHAEN